MKHVLTYAFCLLFFCSFGQKNILGNDTTLCEGDLLLIKLFDLNAQKYTWQDGQDNPFYIIQKTGTYSVTATFDTYSISDTIRVVLLKMPTLSLGKDTTVCDFLPISLSAKNNNATYLWSDGEKSEKRIITKADTYWVKVLRSGCVVSDTIVLAEKKCEAFQYYAPNAFSPNGDDINDTWQINVHQDYPVKQFLLQIFDQWGNQIFDNQDITKGWDGTNKSEPVASDTYVYRLSMTYFNPFTKKEKTINTGGDIFLVR
jgi:gliding motility-associated-like protein